jgi:uncharacterized membrane protein
VIGNKFRTYRVALYLTTLVLIVIQVPKIIYRMSRSYMFNRLVYRVQLFLDFIVLHVIVLFVITPLFDYTSFFYFMMMTLPANLIAVYFFDKINERKLINLLADTNYNNTQT